MYVVMPALTREVNRQLEFLDPSGEPQADYSISRARVEIPLGAATLVGSDAKKSLTKAKEQDEIILRPKVLCRARHRVLHVECHPLLYSNGIPVFKRIYSEGDLINHAISWLVTKDTDLSTLPYLYEIYIVDQHVR